jgi:hypothetical protein
MGLLIPKQRINVMDIKSIRLSDLGVLESMNDSRVSADYYSGPADLGDMISHLATGWKSSLGTLIVLPIENADAIRGLDHVAAVKAARVKELEAKLNGNGAD